MKTRINSAAAATRFEYLLEHLIKICIWSIMVKYFCSGAVITAVCFACFVYDCDGNTDLKCEGYNNGSFIGNEAEITNICTKSCNRSTESVENENAAEPNVAVAFLLVCAAGLSTCLGAAVVFYNKLIIFANRRVLAGCLGFASGVMLYISFADIMVKSKDAFTTCDCLWEHNDPTVPACVMSTLMFFCGIMVYKALDIIVYLLEPYSINSFLRTIKKKTGHGAKLQELDPSDAVVSIPVLNNKLEQEALNVQARISDSTKTHKEKLFEGTEPENRAGENTNIRGPATDNNAACSFDKSDDNDHNDVVFADSWSSGIIAPSNISETPNDDDQKGSELHDLNRMSLVTALAISLHNFPEGMTTFVAAMADPRTGAALAVAIAVHNIPEGICISLPVYYATGSRWRGFLLASLSGIAEVLGALLGYVFLIKVFDDIAYGVLFGLVAGMMVGIVMFELFPTALRHDPDGKIVSISFSIGMGVIALSLMLFII